MNKFITYSLVVILMALGIFYTNRAHASISPFDFECVIFEGDEDYVDPTDPMFEKCLSHHHWMIKYFNKATEITWYLPNYDDKEKGKLCFSTAIALAMPPNNLPKIIGVAVGLFTKYGLDCIDSFHEVQHYLHRAAYHAEMYTFYLEIIKKQES